MWTNGCGQIQSAARFGKGKVGKYWGLQLDGGNSFDRVFGSEDELAFLPLRRTTRFKNFANESSEFTWLINDTAAAAAAERAECN